MKKIDVAELRQLTEEAVRRGTAERESRLAFKRAETERVVREEELLAQGIVAQIPGRVQTEASAGRNHAIVMSLRYGKDYENSGAGNTLHPSSLMGVGKLVYNECVEATLRPSLEFWYDGGGMDSGFNIVVHW